MITKITDIKPSPFAINQVRVSVENLGADLKFHLKNLGISETAYKESVAYLNKHWDEYTKWLAEQENNGFFEK